MFGDLTTADAFFSLDGHSEDGDSRGVVIRDAYAGWLACYHCGQRFAESAYVASDFVGPREKVGTFCSNALGSSQQQNL